MRDVFRRLELLSIRYTNSQNMKSRDRWQGMLSADFTFLDSIAFAEPQKLAESMTDQHMNLFVTICNADSQNEGHLKKLYEYGRWLSDNVRECALADGFLAEKLVKIMGVSYIASTQCYVLIDE